MTLRSTLSSTKHFSLISHCTAHELIQPEATEGQESELCHTLLCYITYLSVWESNVQTCLIPSLFWFPNERMQSLQNWRLCWFSFNMIWMDSILLQAILLYCPALDWIAICITATEANGCHQYKFCIMKNILAPQRNPSTLSPVLSLQLHITTMDNSLQMSRQTAVLSALAPLCQPHHKPAT